MRVAVVGVGLIGASIALAGREKGLGSFLGIDHRSVAEGARGVVDRFIPAEDLGSVRRGIEGADLAVLCAPVAVIRTLLPEVLDVARVVTDCGSTKRRIHESVRSHSRVGRYVPGHPMAGDPRGGLEHARADLFAGKPWLLCPEAADADALAAVEAFVGALGAEPERLGIDEHDRQVAMNSHLPQLMASALAALSHEGGGGVARGPGYASATRVAGGPEEIWRDIFDTNADEIAACLRAYCQELNAVATELEAEPPRVDAALRLLARARR